MKKLVLILPVILIAAIIAGNAIGSKAEVDKPADVVISCATTPPHYGGVGRYSVIEEKTAETTAATETTEAPRETITVRATAYCSCEKCCGYWAKNRPTDENGNKIVYTATGTVAKANRTIAVDPSVIPYGTALLIDGITYVAEDCGGAIKGNRIDIYFDSHEKAREFGVKDLTAEIIERG